MFPRGSLFKKKKKALEFFFIFFFSFTGDIQWKLLQRHRRKEPGSLRLRAELIPIPVPRGGERAEEESRRSHDQSGGDGNRGRKAMTVSALAVIRCMY